MAKLALLASFFAGVCLAGHHALALAVDGTGDGVTGAAAPTRVFTDAELAQCGGKIRIPQLVATPSRILVVAQCRCWGFPVSKSGGCDHPNATAGAPPNDDDDGTGPAPRLTDNMIYSKVVSKASADGGLTWTNFTVLTPLSYSHGMPIYDRVAKQVVLQYQYHPNVAPTVNSTYFQRLSRDDGLTWGPARNITADLAGCNPKAPVEMQVIAAGSKIQTASGRLMFSGHTHGRTQGVACIWYSDDHGATYQTTPTFKGDEASFAELSPPGHLVLNGRGLNFKWEPNRTNYFSADDGTTWTQGAPSRLQDNTVFGCEAALLAVPAAPAAKQQQPTLYFSEPTGTDRTNLVMRCSHDGGKTWPGSLAVNGNKPAAYSALLPIADANSAHGYKLLAMWEQFPNRGPPASFLAQHIGVDWCLGGAHAAA